MFWNLFKPKPKPKPPVESDKKEDGTSKYRIINFEEGRDLRILQVLHKGKWRFIPYRDVKTKLWGDGCDLDKYPTYIAYFFDSVYDYAYSYHFNEADLVNITKQYPKIEDFVKSRIEIRKEYLEEQKKPLPEVKYL